MALIVHKEWSKRVRIPGKARWIGAGVGTIVTFYFVCICWIFFRSPDLPRALSTAKAFVLWRSAGTATLSNKYLWILGVLAVLHILFYGDRVFRWLLALPWWLFTPLLGAVAALAAALTPPGTRPFIYFQF